MAMTTALLLPNGINWTNEFTQNTSTASHGIQYALRVEFSSTRSKRCSFSFYFSFIWTCTGLSASRIAYPVFCWNARLATNFLLFFFFAKFFYFLRYVLDGIKFDWTNQNERNKNRRVFVYKQIKREKNELELNITSHTVRMHQRQFCYIIYFREFGNKTRAYLEWTERMRIVQRIDVRQQNCGLPIHKCCPVPHNKRHRFGYGSDWLGMVTNTTKCEYGDVAASRWRHVLRVVRV